VNLEKLDTLEGAVFEGSGKAQTTALVLRLTKTLTNKIEGFIFQFRRKPQRYP
jgi:hypothetical protein